MSTLRISEIFSSVQGEGIWSGIPSTFVRLSGCNLRCVWCDTPYASWNPEGPVLEVSKIVEEISKKNIKHVVVTGGEPMLFDPVSELVQALKQINHTITIETAGTIYRELPADLMSISPKLSNSTPPADTPSDWANRHNQTRLQPEILAKLIQNYNYQLKFVLADPNQDLKEIDELLANLPPVTPERILLMPEGRNSTVLNSRLKELVPIAMDRGWRICPRLQIDLFGDTKGT